MINKEDEETAKKGIKYFSISKKIAISSYIIIVATLALVTFILLTATNGRDFSGMVEAFLCGSLLAIGSCLFGILWITSFIVHIIAIKISWQIDFDSNVKRNNSIIVGLPLVFLMIVFVLFLMSLLPNK